MRNLWVIAEKEFKHFFISPIAYAVSFAILLIVGIIFYANILAGLVNQFAPTIQVVTGPLVTLLLFMTPAITMRSVAEETRTGTLELILTAPVRDWELVVGKWLGGMLFILVLLLVTWVFPAILNQLVQPGIDQGLMVASYLGILLLASSFLAIGVMTSSWFSNQIAAFFATMGILLVFWLIGIISQASGNVTGFDLLSYLDFNEHLNSFSRGVIELKDVVYFVTVTALALYLGSVSVETRRWR